MPRNVDHETIEGACALSTSRDWPFNDQTIMNEGVTFNVRYIGCLEIKASMKMLDFLLRSQVAKECINRVCESASLKAVKKRRVDKRIVQCISNTPDMQYAGTNVTLTVSSKYLSLANIDDGVVLIKHNMPKISFASGGDTETLDFVAYVAKNTTDDYRACYVLECGGEQAKDVIATIGQAFELRYKEYNFKYNEYFKKPVQSSENLFTDKDYYNDLPEKLPPDMLVLNEDINDTTKKISHRQKSRDRLSSNLIDLNSPSPHQTHDYVNDDQPTVPIPTVATTANIIQHVKDVFDIAMYSLSAKVQRSQLMAEPWFHPNINRLEAEQLIKVDGDFLVRESSGKPGQYVLSGLQSTVPKHLLLIDPAGIVRTKDRIFDNISHLINYHWTNCLPIISEESTLVLRNPIKWSGYRLE